MTDFIVALQSGDNKQVFFVKCNPSEDAVRLTAACDATLLDAKVIAVGPLTSGINLAPREPKQWL